MSGLIRYKSSCYPVDERLGSIKSVYLGGVRTEDVGYTRKPGSTPEGIFDID